MTSQISMRGTRYDDGEPLWLSNVNNDMVFNRVTERWVSFASLNATAVAAGWDWAPREVGIPSLAWRLTHRNMNYDWGPGLDDTAGLASEGIVNGEDFTAATGSTPPTGWDAVGLAPRYAVSAGVLTIDSTGAGDVGMEQTVTVTAGTPYVLEMAISGSGWTLTVNGTSIQIPAGERTFAVSIIPDGTEIAVKLTTGAEDEIAVDYVRLYEESELTGSGGSAAVVTPNLVGPKEADGVVFWVNRDTCQVGFNVDNDAEPDLWVDGAFVCDTEQVSDEAKMGISLALMAEGCDKLPCVTAKGNMKRTRPVAAPVESEGQGD